MESPSGARSAFMATLPAQIIRVEKPRRLSTCETIVEESRVEDLPGVPVGEVAPAAVITVKKQAFQSSLETIWEDTMHYMADYFVLEAAEVILRPVIRFNYSFENLSNHFYIDRPGVSPIKVET